MKNKRSSTLVLLFILSLAVVLVGCGGDSYPTNSSSVTSSAEVGTTSSLGTATTPPLSLPENKAPELDPTLGAVIEEYTVGETTTESGELVKNPVATIEMESGGKIVIELLPEFAPNTVKNFIKLANSGFYNGVVFHRIIPNFMIQGGDPDGTGMGGPGYGIKGEFSQNGFTQNTLSHTEGVVSMARSGHPDSAGSQFFICDSDEATFLDNQYTAFGKVVSGIDLVKALAREEAGGAQKDTAVYPRAMKSVTVDTFGHDWGDPEIIEG